MGKKLKRQSSVKEAHQFVLIPKREALLRKLTRSIENAQRTLDRICSWTVCVQALSDLSSKYQQALKKGVKIRYITNKEKAKESELKTLRVLLENPLFELRYVLVPPIQRLDIFDGKEVYVASFPKSGYVASPALWSNTASLIALSQHYFNTLWNQANKFNIAQ
jgi:hypothetical protein